MFCRAFLQQQQQVHDLRLNRDVQGGGGFIGDQQLRSPAIAMAITTRWRIPPDSWSG